MDKILILDTETTGTDPAKDRVIEVGCVLWSVKHAAIVECFSSVVQGDGNAAEAVNGIPADVLSYGRDAEAVWECVYDLACLADALVAHNAAFDRSFTPPDVARRRPWICTMSDVAWPKPTTSRSLTGIALSHGVGVVSAHRALTDCLTIARLLERCHELGHDVRAMLARGLRPKARFAAVVSYDDREKAKAAGFQWEGATKTWWRDMAIEDAAGLPFETKQIGAAA